MHVAVDQAGEHMQAGRVEDLGRRILAQGADRGDTAVDHADIRFLLAPRQHRDAAAYQEIIAHGLAPLWTRSPTAWVPLG